VYNFQDIYPTLVNKGAAVLVDSPELLAHYLAAYLDDPSKREQAGEAGLLFLEQQRGVVERLMPYLDELLKA
jgi:3-deoxy-D-manno-octulosonic-acid transferase